MKLSPAQLAQIEQARHEMETRKVVHGKKTPDFEMKEIELMKRVDQPGFGVYLKGSRYVCPLPEGYDGRCEVALQDGRVLVRQEGLAPLQCDCSTGTVRSLN